MNNLKFVAFYLPQFHPIPENDLWYEEGFTEWTNVKKAKPQFYGHYQPKVPSELGYYDLRNPRIREKQAILAKEAGISAFCYYDYWFGNKKRLLEYPISQVIKTNSPDFPFCFCWANHSWYKKNWNPDTKALDNKLLLEQKYNGVDDYSDHFYALLDAFKDQRYYKIGGKLLYVIYSPTAIPDFLLFKSTWNQLAEKNGLKGFYFIAYSNYEHINEFDKYPYNEFDAVILSLLNAPPRNCINNKLFRILFKSLRKTKEIFSDIFKYPLNKMSYKSYTKRLISNLYLKENVYPEVIPNWDYTPRRGRVGLILTDSKPQYFKNYVKKVINLVLKKRNDNRIIFIKSWNEWGEGNYMEPDVKYGKGYINALHDAITESIKK